MGCPLSTALENLLFPHNVSPVHFAWAPSHALLPCGVYLLQGWQVAQTRDSRVFWAQTGWGGTAGPGIREAWNLRGQLGRMGFQGPAPGSCRGHRGPF